MSSGGARCRRAPPFASGPQRPGGSPTGVAERRGPPAARHVASREPRPRRASAATSRRRARLPRASPCDLARTGPSRPVSHAASRPSRPMTETLRGRPSTRLTRTFRLSSTKLRSTRDGAAPGVSGGRDARPAAFRGRKDQHTGATRRGAPQRAAPRVGTARRTARPTLTPTASLSASGTTKGSTATASAEGASSPRRNMSCTVPSA